MARYTYTTVQEMTDEVNQLYNLLAEAKKISLSIITQNYQNWSAIQGKAEEALAEKRPLSMEERKEEAKKYIEVFHNLVDLVGEAEKLIGDNY
ncbi:MAG: hypothetical protein J5658_03945 [Prevotella sp.]|nr:hypothetical protein [Prevotella sp.]